MRFPVLVLFSTHVSLVLCVDWKSVYDSLYKGGKYKPNVNSSNEAAFVPLVSRLSFQGQHLQVVALGCGLCAAASHYSDALGPSADIHGMDLSTDALAAARKLGRDAHCRKPPCLKQGSILNVPWPDGQFDVAVCSDVLEHIAPDRVPAAVGEIARVVRHVAFIGIPLSSSVNNGVELHLSKYPADWWVRNFDAHGFTRVPISLATWRRVWAHNRNPHAPEGKPLWTHSQICNESPEESAHPEAQRCTMLFAFVKGKKGAELARKVLAAAEEFAATGLRVPTGRNIYIDLGANWANTLRLHEDIVRDYNLRGRLRTGRDGAPRPFEVYAFEAAPHIQPYVAAFAEHLNSGGPPPCVIVPPAGSSWVLARYAYENGCCDKRGATWESNVRHTPNHVKCPYHCCPPSEHMPPRTRSTLPPLEACMHKRFQRPLKQVALAGQPASADEVQARMAEAATPHAGSRPRYTFVPAAAGAAAGFMPLHGVTPIQLIHGGAGSRSRASFNATRVLSVPVANVVDWLSSHFRKEDLVLLKTDIEGGEFPVMDAMITRGGVQLIDFIVWECHPWAGDCAALEQALRKANPRLVFAKEHDGTAATQGYDSSSAPERLMPPLDPLAGFAGVERARVSGKCSPVAAYTSTSGRHAGWHVAAAIKSWIMSWRNDV